MRQAKLFRGLIADRSGATAVEYGLIVGLLAATILSALQIIGDGLLETLTTISNAITGSV